MKFPSILNRKGQGRLGAVAAVAAFGAVLLVGAVLLNVVNEVLNTTNTSGGMWDIGTFLLGVIPVVFGIFIIISFLVRTA